MDDGTLQAKQVKFMTHSFTVGEVQILADRLSEMGIQGAFAQPVKKNNKTYHLLTVPTEGARLLLENTRPYAHPAMIYKWEPVSNHHTCRYCYEEFETRNEVKITKHTVFVSCTKVTCRRQMRRDQAVRDTARRVERRPITNAQARIKQVERRPITNAQARIKRANTPQEQLRQMDKEARERRFKTAEQRKKFNDSRKRWRKDRKARGVIERANQMHTCQFCQQEFSNSGTHKIGKRSPVIYCTMPDCFRRGKNELRSIANAKARAKWAIDHSAT
jgi:transcription elongation factor Elf1